MCEYIVSEEAAGGEGGGGSRRHAGEHNHIG